MNQTGGVDQHRACCVAAVDAPRKHRLDAALLLMRLAQELCNPEVAVDAYAKVEPLVDETSTDYSARMVPIVYHATFGNPRSLTPSGAKKLRVELRYMEPFTEQFPRGIQCINSALKSFRRHERGDCSGDGVLRK